jgi:hypothetical protein
VQARAAAARAAYGANGAATQLALTQTSLRLAPAAQTWAKALFLARGRGRLLTPSSVAPRALLWPTLWRFVTTGQDIRNVALSAHAAETPAYLLSRALILLSIRRELHTRHAMAWGPRVAQAAHPTLALVSASAPLAQELTSLACPGAYQVFGRRSDHLLASLHLIAPTHASLVGATWVEGWQARAAATRNTSRAGFVPMRSDVGSIRRLRVTKGVCLPSDIPMHVICGSKDVIHSWAIPGLGIKIDCIPGFNSHRRVLLR